MTMPTRFSGRLSKTYINGVDLSSDMCSFKINPERIFHDVTTQINPDTGLAPKGHLWYPGMHKDIASYHALLNGNAGTAYSQIIALLASPDTQYGVMEIIGSEDPPAVGDPVWAANGVKLTKPSIPQKVSDLLWLDAEFVTENYPFENGKLLMAKTQKTVDWTGTVLDNGASSSSGGVGYIQVFEQTGGTGCTLSIRHSSDNFVADDTELFTFGNFATAGVPTTLRVVCAGTVKRYIKVKGVFAGGGPYTCTPAIMFVRL